MLHSQLSSVRSDGSRNAIYPADVQGRFIRARRAVFTALVGFYVALPFLRVGGHPLLHLDVAQRRFYLLGGTFNAQDAWMLVLLFATIAFTLFFVTAWLGRVWCGWACPQTVFLELLYRPIERLIEGPDTRRRRVSQGPWTLERVARAALKHTLYLALSSLIAHAVVALFVSAERLASMVREGPKGHGVEFAWSVVITAVLYVNYAWFREQLCIVVCPYGRLQSALIDRDSLVVGYDVKRGEPRGHISKLPVAGAQGDCVDCARCVQVCPTGIDIRNGLQLECIACAQCVDACDKVMTTVGRPKGLIRYDSLNGLAGTPRRTVRPRLFAYGALMTVAASGLGFSVASRTPFEANLMRAPGAPFVRVDDRLQNQFELHIVNKSPETRTFTVRALAPSPLTFIVPQTTLTLGSLESHRMPIFASAPAGEMPRPVEIAVEVTQSGTEEVRRRTASFLVPPGGVRR